MNLTVLARNLDRIESYLNKQEANLLPIISADKKITTERLKKATVSYIRRTNMNRLSKSFPKENQTTGKEVRVKVFIWPIMDKPEYIYYDTHGEAIEHLAKEATRLSKEQLRLLGKLSYIEKLAAKR